MIIALSPLEFNAMCESAENFQTIDVRDREAFATKHIPGSINVPLAELTDAVAEYNTSSRIVFVCQSGMRSLQAANFLESLGYSEVASLVGGLNAWSNNG